MPRNSAAEVGAHPGAEPSDDHSLQIGAYRLRARRSRWLGVACGLVAGIGPLAGEDGHSLVIPRMLAGYLFGVLLGEMLRPRLVRGQMRAASLHPRSASDLIPWPALLLPWLVLTPLLAAPLLDLGSHPRGVTRFSSPEGQCFGRAYWPHAATLFSVATLAAVGLVLFVVALRRVTQRPQAAESLAVWRQDRDLRARSARAVVASASSMGLVLLALVGQYVDDGIHSYDCTRSFSGGITAGNVYSWAERLSPWLSDASLALMILAIPIFIVCQRLPLPSQDEPSA